MKKLLFLIPFLLIGCAEKYVPLDMLTGDNLKTLSDGSTSKVQLVVESSVAKEIAVHKTLQNRDKQIAKAAEHAGMRMDYKAVTETIKLPSMKEPIILTRQMPIVSYQPMPEFHQPLPTEPSRHPAWGTLDNAISTIGHAGLIGYGIHEAAGAVKALGANAGNRTTINSGGGDVTGGNVSSQSITQQAGGNISTVADNKPCQGEKCGGGEDSGLPEVDSRGGGACTTPAIYGNGIFWWDRVGGCSCASHKDGKC